MPDAHVDVRKHVRAYVGVFSALAILTVLTVLVAQIEFHGAWNVVIALAIAAIKASLVAAIFMHLKWENAPSVWWVLVLCAVFFAVLMLLPVLTVQELPPRVKIGSWG